MAGFDPQTSRKLDATKEITVETRRAPDAPAHRTTIWIVTSGQDAFIRSYRGRRGRWYREVLANPTATLLVGRLRIPVRIRTESRPPVVERVSEAYRRKYGKSWPEETEAMLRPPVRRTTIRLTPA